MSKNFLSALHNSTNLTLTENAAVARATTNSELLNFFSVGGALRERSEAEISKLFDKAFAENPEYALKAAFYFRDVRGGQGERRTFREIVKYLAKTDFAGASEWLKHNLHLVPFYGRWDDLFVLFGTPLEDSMTAFVKNTLQQDWVEEYPTLLAKWMPSENASSAESKRLAYKFITAFRWTPRSYRKILSELRKRVDVLERKLSANAWNAVSYERVPSQANLLYKKAFKRHDGERYEAFLGAVKTGEKKIHAATLFPYDVVRKCFNGDEDEKTLDALWSALPNYAETKENALVVADVSGSMFMSGEPLPGHVCISLAIYAAERNTGVFHNKFITFSDEPTLQSIVGTTISKKVRNLQGAHWNMNTNIEAVFDLILDTAIKSKLSQDDLPQKLYVISDMEFDGATRGYSANKTLFQTIAKRYKDAGYEMPLLVFWNVQSRNDQFPMSMDDRGFLNVSGCSPSIFKNLIKSEYKTAYDFMIEVLSADRYKAITI